MREYCIVGDQAGEWHSFTHKQKKKKKKTTWETFPFTFTFTLTLLEAVRASAAAAAAAVLSDLGIIAYDWSYPSRGVISLHV